MTGIILFLALGLVLAIGVIVSWEAACRKKWNRQVLSDDLYSDSDWRKPFPYIMFKGLPNYRHLNELGYPGPAPRLPKPDREFRVIIFGGSTVFNGDPSIAALLEQECHKCGLDHVRVYNSGVVSSSSGMELARLLFEFVNLTPDLIIFYNGGNDLLAPHTQDPRPGYSPNFVVQESNPVIEKDVGKYPLLPLILYSSLVLRYWRPLYFKKKFVPLDKFRDTCGYWTNDWRDEIVRHYVEHVITAGKAMRGFNTRFIVFFQPLLYFKDPAYVAAEEQHNTPAEGFPYWGKLREQTVRALEVAAEASGVHWSDISLMFSTDSNWVYTDAIHVLQQRHEPIAKRIFEELQRRDLLTNQHVR
jgi:hypothetical protein